MRASNERLTILSEAEQAALYELPNFDDEQRLNYLNLTPKEPVLMHSRSDLSSKIHCALQIGYFKAVHFFFHFEWEEVTEDVEFVLEQYFPEQVIKPSPITKHKYYAQCQIIAKHFGYQMWSSEFEPMLFQQIEQVLLKDISPQFIIMELLAFLREKKIMRPGYSTLQKIISRALLDEKARLDALIQTALSDQIVAALRRQLSWTHFKSLIPLKDPLKRDFYAEMCRIEHWTTRTLDKQIQSMLFERTALSKKPEELIRHEIEVLRDSDKVSTDLILKDPYILDFLGMKDRYLEKDLEDAILREIERFILELGTGFSFIARQKRIQIDHRDYYIDLLFYNKRLRRTCALELKLGDFDAAYKGQMELYLRWLAKYEQEPDENPPLGIILCTGKTHEQIELLELDKRGIHVAEYITTLPPKAELQKQLHQSIEFARQRFENKDQ